MFKRILRCKSISNTVLKNREYDTLASLKERSLISQCSDFNGLKQELMIEKKTIYTGFDPTAKSLHVGNLLTIIALLHFAAGGHRVIALIGGATGTVGDPSGKASERQALDKNIVDSNSISIEAQIRLLWENSSKYFEKHLDLQFEKSQLKIMNNLEWIGSISLLEFLAGVGRRARVSTMLTKDSVKLRMEGKDDGISYTEFTYQLLQSLDFLHLKKEHGCIIQLGGSDQWGNITSGLDLIRKTENESFEERARNGTYGITIPLVTNASGEKFGKSEGNAIWLNKEMLPVFEFYQFFRRIPDADVEKLLFYFTFLPIETIKDIMIKNKDKNMQLPQKLLAKEVTELVHGEVEAKKCIAKSAVLYDHGIIPSAKDIINAFQGDHRLVFIDRESLNDIVSLVIKSGALSSRNAVTKMIKAGGLYVNKVKWEDGMKIGCSHLIDNEVLLLRSGKSNYRILIIK